MNRNLGDTSLRRKRRSVDPMRAYDALPTPLRKWLSQAALPWSPTSARKIWKRGQAQGLSADETLNLLCQAETRTLARDKHAPP
ncbi:hypothetical protein DS901_01580 [Loktanella sp. D2R18]|uniref:DUF6525 family protein n=1 Tax=Rhodobacterales TaxID=204455 RepID=UPI000DEA65A4|nr:MULTISPECIES: DUF6525 family protein [Rhodobacterales]MDO6590020.1 DUF6525 family protein [Yoonia sp. 1_MG-2023]RBW45843.1 hypothetical protein DS901_01580 [Loktanella sp. D2R18]